MGVRTVDYETTQPLNPDSAADWVLPTGQINLFCLNFLIRKMRTRGYFPPYRGVLDIILVNTHKRLGMPGTY